MGLSSELAVRVLLLVYDAGTGGASASTLLSEQPEVCPSGRLAARLAEPRASLSSAAGRSPTRRLKP